MENEFQGLPHWGETPPKTHGPGSCWSPARPGTSSQCWCGPSWPLGAVIRLEGLQPHCCHHQRAFVKSLLVLCCHSL